MSDAVPVTQPADQVRLGNFESQVFSHTPALLRTAVRMCGNAAEAEDIVQDTLLRAWKYWDRFEPGTNCRAWLFRIMINVIHRRREGLEAVAPHLSMSEPEMTNVLRFESKIEMDENGTAAALAKLPSEYREVLMLVLVEEFSYKEASAMLNIPMGTVMSRLHRARQMMMKFLKRGASQAG
ncbi:MAG: RNA polymerase sigma factor [Blastocatellia bacterium]|nr:RNA polymerase sigma factor [Blastocatellia bacterium]